MNPLSLLTRRSRPMDQEILLRRWKQASISSCWRYEEDWDIPQTRSLAAAYTQQHPLIVPARELGCARAVQGAGITESIEDLHAFFAAARTHTDPAVQQSLTEGWVTATETAPAASCTDPLTGLSTTEHFKRVLHDTCTGNADNTDDFVIARIQLPPLPEGATQLWSVLAKLGACCESAFKNSPATLTYQRNTVTILMPRTPENYLRVLACHTQLTTGTTHPGWEHANISYEPLPAQSTSIMQLLDSLTH